MSSNSKTQLVATFAQKGAGTIDWDQYNSRWSTIWEEGLQPGQRFDAGQCAPSLLQLLRSKQLDVAGKHVLVPGCGRGYDVVAFVEAGAARSLGLDISPEAVKAAEALRDAHLAGGSAEAAARAHFEAADFFDHYSAGSWDAGYDYTFLCALHPDMRTAWAEAWARQLKPGGELVTLVYPVDPTMDPGQGPPWPVTPDLYRRLLLDSGLFELKSLEQLPGDMSHPARAGREWLGRWVRKDGAERRAAGSSAAPADASARM